MFCLLHGSSLLSFTSFSHSLSLDRLIVNLAVMRPLGWIMSLQLNTGEIKRFLNGVGANMYSPHGEKEKWIAAGGQFT